MTFTAADLPDSPFGQVSFETAFVQHTVPRTTVRLRLANHIGVVHQHIASPNHMLDVKLSIGE